jgi:glyoxylase-like metal-dependent hydrolase (beta-lactamase superfamily II)
MAEALPFKTSIDFAYGVPRELASGVIRLVANNPGPFTFKGTNTYIIGHKDLAVVDPGPDDPAHLAALLAYAGGRRISHVLITHAHRDHTDGLSHLLAASGAKTVGFGRRALGRMGMGPSGAQYIDLDFAPDITLRHGQRVEGDGWSFEAIHTPGHAPDHLCFALITTGILFSGDHVMAWNTSVIAPPEGRMSDFLGSLESLLTRTDRLYLPGHGGQLDQPQRLVRAFLVHRRMREQAILDCIRQGDATIDRIVPIVYQGIDSRLLNAASLSVLAHVEHLIERGFVRCETPLSRDRVLTAV